MFHSLISPNRTALARSGKEMRAIGRKSQGVDVAVMAGKRAFELASFGPSAIRLRHNGPARSGLPAGCPARALMGLRGTPTGAIFGTFNSAMTVLAEAGPCAPASIQVLMAAISAVSSFLRFLPGGMMRFLPSLIKSALDHADQQAVGAVARHDDRAVLAALHQGFRNLSSTSLPSGSLEPWQSRQYFGENGIDGAL